MCYNLLTDRIKRNPIKRNGLPSPFIIFLHNKLAWDLSINYCYCCYVPDCWPVGVGVHVTFPPQEKKKFYHFVNVANI